MKWFNGWTVALGTLGAVALFNSRRPGEMTAKRDEIYRECLSGRVPPDRMRAIANAFEKVRCYPQARMLRQRIELQELPIERQTELRDAFQKGMASRNIEGIRFLAQTFDNRGATSSAAKLRRHALALEAAKNAAPKPVVTPPPSPVPPSPVPPSPVPPASESNDSDGRKDRLTEEERAEDTEPAIPVPHRSSAETLTNGKSHHVAVSQENVSSLS